MTLLLHDRSPTSLATCFTGLGLQIVSLSLRFWSRKVNRMPLWWDDWTVLAASPFGIALSLECLYFVFYAGYGKPTAVPDRPADWPIFTNSDYFLATFLSGQLYNTAITLVKLSALLFYSRLFGLEKWFRNALWAVGATSVAWDFAFTTKGFAQRDWRNNAESFEAKKVTFVVSTFSNLIIDIIILLLPHPILWKMHLSKRKKLGVIAVFLAGYWYVFTHFLGLNINMWSVSSGSLFIAW